MTALVDRPLEEWAVSRALFPTRLTQERCARKKKEDAQPKENGAEKVNATLFIQFEEKITEKI